MIYLYKSLDTPKGNQKMHNKMASKEVIKRQDTVQTEVKSGEPEG